MIAMRLSELATAVGGRLEGEDAAFVGCAIDSRSPRPGSVFFALRGPRFDGHRFVPDALRAGAVGAVTALDAPRPESVGPQVRVDDTRRALGRLARHWRTRFALPVLAVTGSNGKTTTKEMLAAVLRRSAARHGATADSVLATRGNLNNEVGVPLTLFELSATSSHAVLELGANHPGEIAQLAAIAQPVIGVVTLCAPAHLEGFGSVEAVARAKGELFESLPSTGTAVINADDPFRPGWESLAAHCRRLTFGLDAAAEVTADCSLEADGARLALRLAASGPFRFRLPFAGRHNVMNALAAAAAAHALGIPGEVIAEGLSSAPAVAGRLVRLPLANGASVLDDSYNANPSSLAAALAVLQSQPGRRWLVLGDMAELGTESERYHAEAGAAARAAGVERLYTLGPLSARAHSVFAGCGGHFEEPDALSAELVRRLEPGVTVLIKGSRSMRMERVVRALAGEA